MDWKEKLQQVFRLKYLLPISLIAVVAAVLLRIIQLNIAVDFSTGFFNKKTILVPLLTVLILLYLGYAIAVLMIHPMRLERPYSAKNALASAIITGASGTIMIIESLVTIVTATGQADDFNTLSWFTVFLKIISGGALLYHGYLFYRKEESRLKNHIFLLFLAVWALLDLVDIFIHHTTVASISEYVFDILFAASLVLFLLYYARFTAGLLQKRQMKMMMATAVCTVMLGAVSAIPRLFCRLLEYQGIGQYISLPSFSTLVMTVFTGWMSFLFVKETLLLSDWNKSKIAARTLDCEYQYETVGIDNLFPKRRIWGRD